MSIIGVAPMDAVHPLADRLLPLDFRRNLPVGTGRKAARTPGAEALPRLGHSVNGNLALFRFEPGQYECSIGILPAVGFKPNRSPAQRVRFGEEERSTSFLATAVMPFL